LLAKEIGVARGEFDGFRKEETLGRGFALFDAIEHLFEEDALMGGVLIEKNEAAIGFEHDVKFANDAEDAKRHFEERNGLGRIELDARWKRSRIGSE
jgi:hypothetical protein